MDSMAGLGYKPNQKQVKYVLLISRNLTFMRKHVTNGITRIKIVQARVPKQFITNITKAFSILYLNRHKLRGSI